MADRPSVIQQVQIGIPGTAGGGGYIAGGTVVQGNYKTLQSISIEPGVQMQRTPFRPFGHRHTGIVPPGKEWTQAPTRGPVTFGEIIYALNSIFGSANPATWGTVAGTAYKYQWTPSNTTIITPQDFVIEQGDSNFAHRFGYAYWHDFGVTYNRDSIMHTGQIMARRITTGATLTGGATTVELVPCLPENVDVYIDSSWANLGTTHLTRVMSVEWRCTGMHGPIWTLDSTQNSFAAPINLAPNVEMRVLLEADTTGIAYLADARSDNRKFLRVACVGGTAGTANYTFQVDMAGEISAVAPFRDEQGVYAVEYTFTASYDGTSGNTQQITVINKTSNM